MLCHAFAGALAVLVGARVEGASLAHREAGKGALVAVLKYGMYLVGAMFLYRFENQNLTRLVRTVYAVCWPFAITAVLVPIATKLADQEATCKYM